MSTDDANRKLQSVINGELPGRWATAEAALNSQTHYFKWDSAQKFEQHPQAGMRLNSALGSSSVVRGLFTAGYPGPLYPGDPEYQWDPNSGRPDNTASPLTIAEFQAGAQYSIYVGLKAHSTARGMWYVNSAYPIV